MPALPTIVTDFLTRIKDDLSVGPQLATPGPGNIRGAAMNYLRAQDMSSVLELLQDALDQTTNLTATGGTTTSVQDTGAFVVGAQVGNFVTFAGNITAALAGLTFRVVSNTTGELFFGEILPGTPANGDTYTIAGGLVQGAIDELRQPRDGAAQTISAAPPGSVFGDMRIVADALNRLTVQLGQTQNERNLGRPGLQVASGSSTTVVQLETVGIPFRIDEFRGAKIVVSGEEPRFVVRNDETSVTVQAAYSSAPTATTAVTLTVAADQANKTYGKLSIHPGAQPGENIFLADLIQQAEDAVIAFTLPT